MAFVKGSRDICLAQIAIARCGFLRNVILTVEEGLLGHFMRIREISETVDEVIETGRLRKGESGEMGLGGRSVVIGYC